MRHRIFEVPDDQARYLVPAIDVGQFPWEKLVPGIQAQVGRDYIPTKLSDLSRWGARAAGDHGHSHDGDVHPLAVMHKPALSAIPRHRVLGLFWTNYQIEVEQSLVNEPTLLAEVLWSEGAHAIDQAMLSDAHRAEIVAALHPHGPDAHPDWWERSDYSAEYGVLPGETFMECVVEAYTPLTATINLHHEVTPHVIDTVRRILTPEPVVPPEPPPFPGGPDSGAGSAPYFGADGSKVAHDSHRGVPREVEWSTWAEVTQAGRRACRVCKPSP